MTRPTAPTRPLGDLVSITRGKTYQSRLLGEPGPILLGLSTIARNGGFRADSLRTYGGDSPENLIVQPGELFASLKDVTQSADLLGSVARLPEGHGVGRLTQDTVRLDLKEGETSRDYLYFALLTPAYRSFCRSHATGTTNLGLPREDFLGYEVPFPPLEEQERIAGVLGAFDDLIETNRRLAANMRAAAQVAARRGMAGHARTVLLTDVATVDKGFSYKSAELDGGEMVLLSLKNAGRGGHFRRDGYKPLSTARHKPGHVVHAGDVVVAMTDLTQDRDIIARPLRVQAPAAPVEIVASLDLAVLRPREGSTREFIWAVLSDPAFRSHALGYCSGTTVLHMKGTALSEYLVPKPDEKLIAYLSETVESLLLGADEVDLEADALTARRDELLPLLMSGKVRVRDVEAAVS